MKCHVWAVVALKTIAGTMVVTHTAQGLKTASETRRLLTGQGSRHGIPLGQQPGNPPSFLPCSLVIGKAPHLAPSAGVVADFERRILVPGDGPDTSVDLNTNVAHADRFHPAATHFHAKNVGIP